MSSDILLITKDDYFSNSAGKLAEIIFGDRVFWVKGHVGDALPGDFNSLTPDIILSFLSPWVLPKALLSRSRIALNWHPASREYPGIGCYNFALYEQAQEYGAVCHYMAEKVDTGEIVEERKFQVFDTDTVETLKLRTMVTMVSMFHDTISRLASGDTPQPSGLSWSRRPFTRRELNALTVIDASMPEAEVKRRVRATTYPGYPGPSVVIGGETFYFPVPNRPPLA